MVVVLPLTENKVRLPDDPADDDPTRPGHYLLGQDCCAYFFPAHLAHYLILKHVDKLIGSVVILVKCLL